MVRKPLNAPSPVRGFIVCYRCCHKLTDTITQKQRGSSRCRVTGSLQRRTWSGWRPGKQLLFLVTAIALLLLLLLVLCRTQWHPAHCWQLSPIHILDPTSLRRISLVDFRW